MYHFPPRRILVPVDFTAASSKALAAARRVASHYGAKLEALYCDPPLPTELAAYAVAIEGRDRKRRLENALRARHGFGIDLLVERGEPSACILSIVAKRRIDLVVMGTHGREGLSRAVLGSVAEAVMRDSRVPVLVVRRAFRMPKTVLAPIREDSDAGRGLVAAGFVARSFQARLEVLQVVTDPIFGVSPDVLFKARVAALPEAIRRDTKPISEVRLGEPVKEILRAARGRDLLVIVARRKSLLGDIVLGTTAERVARHSPIPVLALPSNVRSPRG